MILAKFIVIAACILAMATCGLGAFAVWNGNLKWLPIHMSIIALNLVIVGFTYPIAVK